MRDMRLKHLYKFFELFGSNYWNTRYMLGGGSGYKRIDIDKYADYVWSIIEKVAGKQNDIIDVGCGDLLFWKNRDCENYIGIDISSIIIKRDRKLRPHWDFIESSADRQLPIMADMVICLNTLYHIMDDNDYNKIIDNLIYWSKKWIVVITWDKKPKEIPKDSIYQKYRDFSIYMEKIISSGFTLILKEHLPFDDYGCIWIFKRNSLE